jgi:hypothetical protein
LKWILRPELCANIITARFNLRKKIYSLNQQKKPTEKKWFLHFLEVFMKSFCGLILSSSFLILGVIGCGTSNLNSDPQTMSASEVESEEDSTALIALSPEEALQKNSKEFQGRVRFVDINYKICLGRAPDRAGLIQWVNAITTKKASLQNVQTAICSSIEAQLTQTYREVLARNPDAQGRRYWLSALSRGQRACFDSTSAAIAHRIARKKGDQVRRAGAHSSSSACSTG